MEEQYTAAIGIVIILFVYIVARLNRLARARGERRRHQQQNEYSRPLPERSRHRTSELVVGSSTVTTTRRAVYMISQGTLLAVTITIISDCINLSGNDEGRNGWIPRDGIQCTDAGKENSVIIANGQEYPLP
jgi:hypothetical protein